MVSRSTCRSPSRPGGPTPPAEAANAGFTTLAANYDFSQPLYATQSNWLDCADNNPSLPWHKNIFASGSGIPCNINQVVDPAFGQTVMRMSYLGSYQNTYGTTPVAMETDHAGSTLNFPVGMFMETVYREDFEFSNRSQNGAANGAMWTWQGPSNGFEFDVGENVAEAGGYGDAAWINWQFGPQTSGFLWGTTNIDITVYHKYQMLVTSDGGTQVYACAWYDDAFQSCSGTAAAGINYTERARLLSSVGQPSTLDTTFNQNQYVQYIRVWSCANWVSTACNGSTLYNSGGLTYWH